MNNPVLRTHPLISTALSTERPDCPSKQVSLTVKFFQLCITQMSYNSVKKKKFNARHVKPEPHTPGFHITLNRDQHTPFADTAAQSNPLDVATKD